MGERAGLGEGVNADATTEVSTRQPVTEEELGTIFGSSLQGIVCADSSGHIIFFNSGAERIFGLTQAHAVGQPLTILMPERFHFAHRKGFQRFLDTGEGRVIGTTVELAGKRKDGTEFPLSLSLAAWNAGQQRFFMGILQDLSERSQAEQRLRVREERIRLFIDAVKDYAIYMLDPHGHIISWNAGAERIKGYSSEEILGQHFSRFYPSEDIARGKPKRELEIAAKEGRLEDEGWRVRKDGSRFWANVVLTALRDEGGRLQGFGKVTRDMTERRQAEQALKDSEQRLALALDSAQMGVWDLDLVNDTAQRSLRHDEIFGYSSLQPRWGREIFMSHVAPEDRELVKSRFVEAFKTGQFTMECRIVWPDRSIHWIAAQGHVYRNEKGEPVRMMGVVGDITERKTAEEELQIRNAQLEAANKELEAFSYSVSHDLRAPLRAIDGFSLALLEDCRDKLVHQEREHLDRIRAATRKMGTLIDDMLKLARIARSEIVRTRVDMSQLASEIAAQLRNSDPLRTATFVIAPQLVAEADRGLLRIVLENLLDNAWKFTSKRSQAEIELGAKTWHGGQAYFVRDNGIGFDMRYADKLFGVFQRLHRESEFPGTGIGLASAQRIIHQHGGRMWVEATPGRGATFYFTLQPRAELKH